MMQSWIFSIITPVFSVTWSFRIHSNMKYEITLICRFAAQETFKQLHCFLLFVETLLFVFCIFYLFTYIISQDSLMNQMFDRKAFIIYIYINTYCVSY